MTLLVFNRCYYKIQRMNNRLMAITLYVENNLSNSSLNGLAIAESLSLSRMQIHRDIKQSTGMNAGQLIQKIRMETAKELIQSTNIPITQIAEMVGYKNISYFSKVFKSVYNHSPSYFRV